ncbi:MAG: OB-fold domain-containing protein [Candidatus Aminicenantes bacterium]|nr:OB-fold domain-containing protein [Candidatus Aminicenantes bacterium]
MKTVNGIPPVMPGIFTLPPYDDGPPALLGGFCPACSAYYFPRPKYCRTCLGPVEEARVGSEGTVYSFTVVRKKAPLGLPLPYSVGYVDLKETGLRIFCLLDPAALEKLCIGLPVRLAVNTMGRDINGSPCLRPYFTPASAKGERHSGKGKVEV